ncbi:lysophospholipid acyltransferase family protein [Segatella cerevisiae]|nr:lysophospholipid acyltransferase family protein [Segatella cerevisiae]
MIMTKIVYGLFYLISLLPFRVLYALSDVGYLIVYYVLRYRRQIVRRNLVSSFPEKSESGIIEIEKGFYHWFCDYFFEATKLLSIKEEHLKKRFKVCNVDEVEACFDNGQNVAAVLGHYCNWEWLSCMGIYLPGKVMGLIYHPLANKPFDELFKKIRSSSRGSVVISKKHIIRKLIEYRQKKIMSLFGYISDQGPKWENIHLWLNFMHHDTGVFTGAERIMRKVNDAVFYVEMSRPKRGYYNATFKLITKNPNALPEYEITRRFFALLENTIRKDPKFYLWSHNRWKRTHEEFDRRFEVVNGKVIEKASSKG